MLKSKRLSVSTLPFAFTKFRLIPWAVVFTPQLFNKNYFQEQTEPDWWSNWVDLHYFQKGIKIWRRIWKHARHSGRDVVKWCHHGNCNYIKCLKIEPFKLQCGSGFLKSKLLIRYFTFDSSKHDCSCVFVKLNITKYSSIKVFQIKQLTIFSQCQKSTLVWCCYVLLPLRKYLYATNAKRTTVVAPSPVKSQNEPMLLAFGPHKCLQWMTVN